MTDIRLQNLEAWLKNQLSAPFEITPVTGDASFRRYFRVATQEQTYIAVDAPPQLEDSRPFVAIGKEFLKLKIHVPEIYFTDLDNGFMLIGDLGNQLYYEILNAQNADSYYGKALDELLKIQSCRDIPDWSLPPFAKTNIEQELLNFRTWFLETHLNMQLSSQEDRLLNNTFEKLIESATTQPQCCIHRDYHSKNLMVSKNTVGILDFQDAAYGPITYDAVSLLRDCYIKWPDKKVESWVSNFFNAIKEHHQINIHKSDFIRWFDWMGIQRHLKAIFIFARKFHRDQVDHYLQYIPNGLYYIDSIAPRYDELKLFHFWFKNEVLSRYEAFLQDSTKAFI